MMTARVFVLAQPTVDREGRMPNISALHEWGEVRFVVGADTPTTRQPDRASALLVERLAEFDPARDYLAWVGGDTLTALLAGYVLAVRQVESVRWLRFDRDRDPRTGQRIATGRYRPVTVRFDLRALPADLLPLLTTETTGE